MPQHDNHPHFIARETEIWGIVQLIHRYPGAEPLLWPVLSSSKQVSSGPYLREPGSTLVDLRKLSPVTFITALWHGYHYYPKIQRLKAGDLSECYTETKSKQSLATFCTATLVKARAGN